MAEHCLQARAESIALAANSSDFSVCALRPSVILGPGDYQLVPSVHACIAKGETPFVIGSGDNLYDFTYVENVAHAHVLAVENLLGPKTAAGHAFFITNQQAITFRDFCLAVWAEFGHKPPFSIVIPGDVAWAFGWVAECFGWLRGKPFTLSRGSVKDGYGTRYASNEKAVEILGYRPLVDLWDGIRITAEVRTGVAREIIRTTNTNVREQQAYRKQLETKASKANGYATTNGAPHENGHAITNGSALHVNGNGKKYV